MAFGVFEYPPSSVPVVYSYTWGAVGPWPVYSYAWGAGVYVKTRFGGLCVSVLNANTIYSPLPLSLSLSLSSSLSSLSSLSEYRCLFESLSSRFFLYSLSLSLGRVAVEGAVFSTKDSNGERGSE